MDKFDENLIKISIAEAGYLNICTELNAKPRTVYSWAERGFPYKKQYEIAKIIQRLTKNKRKAKDLLTESWAIKEYNRLQTLQKSQQRPVSSSDTSKK